MPSPGSTIDAGATCSVTTQTDQDIVQISHAFAGDIKAGKPVVFVIQEVRNAGSLKGVDSIKVQTQKLDGSAIDYSNKAYFAPTE